MGISIFFFAVMTSGNAIGTTAAIEWSTVFEVLLGAVVGFLSTGFTNWVVKKVHIHKLTQKLRFEINSNIQGLQKIQDDKLNSYTLNSPIWDEISNSNILLDIPTDIYVKLVNIYTEVKHFNRAEENVQKRAERGEPIDKEEICNMRKHLISVMKDNSF